MLGGEAQEAGIGLRGLLSLDSAAAELAGAVIESLRHTDADSLGQSPALPSGDGFQVVHALDDPDKPLGLHQVEGDSALDVLALGDDAHGDVPYNRGLHDGRVCAVLVDALGGQPEVVQVPVERILLVEGEQSILQGPLGG